MKIVIEGTPEECAEAVRRLAAKDDIKPIFAPLPDAIAAHCPHGRLLGAGCPHCLGIGNGRDMPPGLRFGEGTVITEPLKWPPTCGTYVPAITTGGDA